MSCSRSEGLHILFTDLTYALDHLPTDADVALLSSPHLRDDSLSLLHAMDRVLGTSTVNEISDSPVNSDEEDGTRVGSH